MPEDSTSTYLTRSYMFGGPWHLMVRLPELSSDARALAASEIRTYKQIRSRIQTGKAYHVTAYPGNGKIDALQSYNAANDSVIAIVTRESSTAKIGDHQTLRVCSGAQLPGTVPGRQARADHDRRAVEPGRRAGETPRCKTPRSCMSIRSRAAARIRSAVLMVHF